MEMLLMGLCMGFLGLAVAAIAFNASARSNSASEVAAPAPMEIQPAASRFFADRIIPPVPDPGRIPIEVLMGRIESHVRQEQQAAESFIDFPAPHRLHTKTQSPLVN